LDRSLACKKGFEKFTLYEAEQILYPLLKLKTPGLAEHPRTVFISLSEFVSAARARLLDLKTLLNDLVCH